MLRDLDSAESIEENIYELKLRMVDITLRQQDLGGKIKDVRAEVEVQQAKIVTHLQEQQEATDREDYDAAASIDERIAQVKQLIAMKERESAQYTSQISDLESLKSERLGQLSKMMLTSLQRFCTIRKER